MAVEPPVQPGQLSPDGKWQWDGTRWVPAAPVTPAVPRRSRSWIWWLAGGCAVVLLLVIAGAAFGSVALYSHLERGGFTCLPSTFPRYPGSTFGNINYELNGPTPGNSCNMVFESKDSVGAVLDYYQTRLNRGDWQVSSIDQETGQIEFRSVKRAKTHGTLGIAAVGDHTQITVQLYS